MSINPEHCIVTSQYPSYYKQFIEIFEMQGRPYRRDDGNVDRYRPERVLRTAPKVKMKVEFTDRERVLRSPFYVCNRLWDKLDSETQLSANITAFTNMLHKIDLSEL